MSAVIVCPTKKEDKPRVLYNRAMEMKNYFEFTTFMDEELQNQNMK